MHKNPANTDRIFEDGTVSMLFCDGALIKTRFLSTLARESATPVLYLDFDLLYTGYHRDATDPKVTVFRPDRDNLDKIMGQITDRISSDPHTVIVDSLAGASNVIRGADPAILLNVYLMMAASTMSGGSRLIVASLGKKRDGEWVCVPINRHVIVSPVRRFHLKQDMSVTEIDDSTDGAGN